MFFNGIKFIGLVVIIGCGIIIFININDTDSNEENLQRMEILNTQNQSIVEFEKSSSLDQPLIVESSAINSTNEKVIDIENEQDKSGNIANLSIYDETNLEVFEGSLLYISSHSQKDEYGLSTEEEVFDLDFSKPFENNNYQQFINKRVQIEGFLNTFEDTIIVRDISLQTNTVQPEHIQKNNFTGERKIANILCRFSDYPKSTPYQPSWFYDNINGNNEGDSYHFWNEVSDGQLKISGDVFGWYDLSNPQSYYFNQHFLMMDDCIEAADPEVYFPNYDAIYIYFNENITDANAAGWYYYLNLDSRWQRYGVVWAGPGWGYDDPFVVEHEAGHGMGLSHSSAPEEEYGSYWDVMSEGYGYNFEENRYHPAGLIAYYRERLGWMPESQIKYFDNETPQTFKLDVLNQYDLNSENFRMLKINLPGNEFYTVESRKKVGYDKHIPFEGVLIHKVKEVGDSRAVVVDVQEDGEVNNEGSVLRVGESFVDVENNLVVKVISDYGDGYDVQINYAIPSVRITNSTNSVSDLRYATGSTITVEVEASDDDAIVDVDFYLNEEWMGADSTYPYSFDFTDMQNGDHSIYAVANDNIGLTNITNVRRFVVANPEYTNTLESGVVTTYNHLNGSLSISGQHDYGDSCSQILSVELVSQYFGYEILKVLNNQNLYTERLCKYRVGVQNYEFIITHDFSYSELEVFDTMFIMV